MNITIVDSWLRDFLKTEATPKEIQNALSLCGASVERLHQKEGDFLYEVEVTTNRPDMMSVVGIAKEAVAILPHFNHKATLLSDPLRKPLSLPLAQKVDYLTVKLEPKLCPRFTAILIKNVVVKQSPAWVIKRLELSGMRGLNNVIDISNYLMLELGQPVHTFDYDKIQGAKMIVRESKKGEKLTTLDGKVRSLPGGDIVIEDGKGRLIDLCGIMGGENSAIDNKTKNVLLFVQTYEPVHIRRTSMSLALRTGAAVLFEKGTPIENVPPTLEQGIELFKKFTGGEPVKSALDIVSSKEIPQTISLTIPLADFVNTRLGIRLPQEKMAKILESLGFKVKSANEVEVPPERKSDITIPEDLVEEIARIHGYHNLPNELMTGLPPTQRDDHVFFWEQKIKSTLSDWGFTECYTYSLVSQELETNPKALKLKNPLSEDWEYLRTSLTPSHLKVISDNLGRTPEINLFEIANVYLPRPTDLPNEESRLIISSTNLDFSKLKGYLEGLFEKLSLTLELSQKMEILFNDKPVGQITLHTSPKCTTVEIKLSPLISAAKVEKRYTPISKFSAIVEDINFTLTPGQSYARLVERIKATSSLITDVSLVDRYSDKLTLRISFLNRQKQLSSGDIEPIRKKLLKLS